MVNFKSTKKGMKKTTRRSESLLFLKKCRTLKDFKRSKRVLISLNNTHKSKELNKSLRHKDNLTKEEHYHQNKVDKILNKIDSKTKMVDKTKEQKEKEQAVKNELAKLKRDEVEFERMRIKRIDSQKKDKLNDGYSQISINLLESKIKNSILERVKMDENKKTIQSKDQKMTDFVNSQIWNN